MNEIVCLHLRLGLNLSDHGSGYVRSLHSLRVTKCMFLNMYP